MEHIFTIDFIVTLTVLAAVLCFAYWRDRIMDRKLGKIHAVMVKNKHKKIYQYRHLVVFGQVLLGTIGLLTIHILFREEGDPHSNPLTIPLVIMIPQLLAHYRPLTFGENGIVLGDSMFSFGRARQFISWDTIRDVEWDRDVKQQQFGFTLFFKKGAAPFKASVEREYQPQAAELFTKFLKTENEPEKVLI